LKKYRVANPGVNINQLLKNLN